MSQLWQDVRHGFRLLRKQPAFSILALLTLALGIGAATTIFSVIQNVLFDPFPGHTVERVVAFHIHDAASGRPGGRSSFQVPEFREYETQVQAFEEVIGGAYEDVLYTTRDGAEQFTGGLVTPNNFSFLGVPAARGRVLLPDDARPGAPPVFVLTHKAWLVHFAGDGAVLGRTFVLNGVPTTLVGIMPPHFAKLGADLYRPVALEAADAAIKGGSSEA
jgi:putative ABC transport system permease protein